jgi:hypothetical protein
VNPFLSFSPLGSRHQFLSYGPLGNMHQFLSFSPFGSMHQFLSYGPWGYMHQFLSFSPLVAYISFYPLVHGLAGPEPNLFQHDVSYTRPSTLRKTPTLQRLPTFQNVWSDTCFKMMYVTKQRTFQSL